MAGAAAAENDERTAAAKLETMKTLKGKAVEDAAGDMEEVGEVQPVKGAEVVDDEDVEEEAGDDDEENSDKEDEDDDDDDEEEEEEVEEDSDDDEMDDNDFASHPSSPFTYPWGLSSTSSSSSSEDDALEELFMEAQMIECEYLKLQVEEEKKQLRKHKREFIEDMGTEFLVQPVGEPEDEEDLSEFEPDDVDDDDTEDEETDEEDDHEGGGSAGTVEASDKRKRSGSEGDESGGDVERATKK